MSITEGLIPGA